MSYRNRDPEILRTLLEQVLPELLPASKATIDGADFYKSIDRLGNVYKIANPAKAGTYTDSDGRLWVKRKPPELVIRAEDLNKVAGGASPTEQKSRKERDIF